MVLMSENFALNQFMMNTLRGGMDTGGFAGSGNGIITQPIESHLKDLDLKGDLKQKVQVFPPFRILQKFVDAFAGMNQTMNLGSLGIVNAIQPPSAPIGVDLKRKLYAVSSPSKGG